jgi:hypothetical protein
VLLSDWLCLAFPFLSQHQLESPIKMAQDVAFDVLSSPGHLPHIWRQIEESTGVSLFGAARARKGGAVAANTLDIFGNILERPLDEENYGRFVILLRALAGDKHTPYADNLFNLLSSVRVGDVLDVNRVIGGVLPENKGVQPQWSLMQYLIKVFATYTDTLSLPESADMVTDREMTNYMNLVSFFCALINQNFLLYLEINNEEFLPMVIAEREVYHIDDSMISQSDRLFHDPALLSQRHPLLRALMDAFTVIIQYVTPANAVLPLKSLVKTFRVLYKSVPVQPELLAWMQAFLDPSGIPVIVNFFTFNLHESDFPANTYAITRAFLRFTECLFHPKQDTGLFLPVDQRLNLSESLLGKYLVHVYQTLIQNFSQLIFKDLKDFLKMYRSLLKITERLLARFKDQAPQAKAPLAHRYPHYDELLRMVTEAFNSEGNLEFLLVNALMLEEDTVKGQSSGITNKFWL